MTLRAGALAGAGAAAGAVEEAGAVKGCTALAELLRRGAPTLCNRARFAFMIHARF